MSEKQHESHPDDTERRQIHLILCKLTSSVTLSLEVSTTCPCLTRMDAREETLGLLSKIWFKLQSLPDASPVELGAFFVLLTFICESLLSIITHLSVFYKDGAAPDVFISSPCSGRPGHNSADLRVVLLLLLSQDQDEGLEHLSKTSSWSYNQETDIGDISASCRMCLLALEEPSPYTTKQLTNTEKKDARHTCCSCQVFRRSYILWRIPAIYGATTTTTLMTYSEGRAAQSVFNNNEGKYMDYKNVYNERVSQ